MITFSRALSAFILCLSAAGAMADTYPSKPIQLVVPFAAGGSTDIVGRAIGEQLSKSLGQPVVVLNKAGAGGTIGSAMVAKERADGYTLMLATVTTLSVVGSLYDKLSYDPLTAFTPITEIATIPQLLVTNPKVPAQSLNELITYAKANPERLSFASGGSGGANHLAAEQLMKMAGVKLNHITYRGSGPALIDVMGHQVDMTFDVVMTSLSYVKSGKLKALAITSKERSPLLPEVPTMDESGLPGYEAIVWFGVVGPAGIPTDVVRILNREIVKALGTPQIQKLLVDQGAVVVGGSPEEFKAKIKREADKWGKLIKEAGIKPL